MIAFIDDRRGVHGVEPICEVLPIAPSTYHAHAAQLRRPTGHNRKAITDFKAVDRTFREWPLRIARSRTMHVHIIFLFAKTSMAYNALEFLKLQRIKIFPSPAQPRPAHTRQRILDSKPPSAAAPQPRAGLQLTPQRA